MNTTGNMGLRERIGSDKRVAFGLIAVVAVVVLAVAWQVLGGAPSSGAGGAPGGLYFTTDDGATTFTAPANHLAPFDHNGKQAVRAVMYSCDGGKTKFVGYLERYTPSAKQQMEAGKQAAQTGGKMVMAAPNMGVAVLEVKKPGEKNAWVDKSRPQGQAVIRVTCPPGSSGTPEEINP